MLPRPPLEKEFEACKSSAAAMLAYRPHSSSELKTKLTDKGYDRETIERALSRLQELVWPLHVVVESSRKCCFALHDLNA